jgi:hypothetical protein
VNQETLQQVRSSLSEVDSLKEKIRGDADLELVLQRVEQIEDLLAAMADLAGAPEGTPRPAAKAKVTGCRKALKASLG